MPSGLTKHIYDSPNSTFKQFASVCARYLINDGKKDDNVDSLEFPELPVFPTYHSAKMDILKEERKNLNQMGEEELRTLAARELIKKFGDISKHMRKALKQRARYLSILTEVEAWEPPTPEHLPFKNFMIKQLKDSISSDCDNNFEFYLKDLWHDHSSYFKMKKLDIEQQIDYHKQQQANDEKSYHETVKWAEGLKKDLDGANVLPVEQAVSV